MTPPQLLARAGIWVHKAAYWPILLTISFYAGYKVTADPAMLIVWVAFLAFDPPSWPASNPPAIAADGAGKEGA